MTHSLVGRLSLIAHTLHASWLAHCEHSDLRLPCFPAHHRTTEASSDSALSSTRRAEIVSASSCANGRALTLCGVGFSRQLHWRVSSSGIVWLRAFSQPTTCSQVAAP